MYMCVYAFAYIWGIFDDDGDDHGDDDGDVIFDTHGQSLGRKRLLDLESWLSALMAKVRWSMA